MLSDDEILRRLRLVKQSCQADRIRGRIISIAAIARRAKLNRTFLHGLLTGQHMLGPTARHRLSETLMRLDETSERPVVPHVKPAWTTSISVLFTRSGLH